MARFALYGRNGMQRSDEVVCPGNEKSLSKAQRPPNDGVRVIGRWRLQGSPSVAWVGSHFEYACDSAWRCARDRPMK
jgi:hypothetical protein